MTDDKTVPCPFCSLERATEWYNVPVGKTENFLAKASVGPLADGHMLLIAKMHVTSMAKLPEHHMAELGRAKTQLGGIVMEEFEGPVVFFEHGDNRPARRKPGCCIDHAHLHCMPFGRDLFGLVEKDYPKFERLYDIAGLRKIVYEDYVYVEDGRGIRVFDTPNLPGQYLRKVICKAEGRPNEWDFWVYPKYDNVRKILDRIGRSINLETNKESY